MRAPYEDGLNIVLARYQSGYDQIVDIVGPHNVNEESFIGILNADGRLKIINYTIIENLQTYQRYARENFGVKSFNNQSRRLEDTPQGQKMIDQGYPLKFISPL